LIAFYNGDAVDGFGSTSIWCSIENETVFAICTADIRRAPLTWIEYLHKKASRNKRFKTNEALEVTDCKLVMCKSIAVLTMTEFLEVKTKTAGLRSNSCSKVGVQSKGNIQLQEEPFEDQKLIAPMLLRTRVLGPNEFVPADFQNKQTISAIVEELGGSKKGLNDIPGGLLLKAIRKFSDHSHCVILDTPDNSESTNLIEAVVDFDSASAVYTKRDSVKRRNIDDILQELNECLGQLHNGTSAVQPCYKGVTEGVWFSGFNSCTSYTPDSFKAFSSKYKGGPTVHIYSNGDRWRVQLPAPVGQEVFKIWIYSPPKLKQGIFLNIVKSIAGKCAMKLMDQYNHHRQMEALRTTLDQTIQGARPFQVPGGQKFPLGIALMFLEDYPDGSFAIDTYGCKSKGARFPMRVEDFGAVTWIDRLILRMRNFMKLNDSMIKTICHLDRIAMINPKLSRIGIGFEFRFVNSIKHSHKKSC
jgi:hypothetical protein